MTPPEQTEAPSSDELTARVQAVDGVSDVYTSMVSAAHLSRAVTALVTGQPAHPGSVAVSGGDGALSITARVGTHADASTPDVARDVVDQLLAAVGAHPSAVVTVQVARVH